MRAAVVGEYGPPDVVRVVDVPRPEPRADEVLVRVQAAAVSSGDARLRAARFPKGFGVPARVMFGLRRPRRPILGGSFAGVVERAGRSVTAFAPGDAVCGMSGMKMGAHAEFVAVPASKLARRPDAVSAVDAAGLLFGGATALHFMRDRASVRPGVSLLVNGASGAVGTNAVQLGVYLGATVTAVTSGANAEVVRELGASRVIDHTVDDVTALDARFDVVLDAVGNLTITSGRRLLAPRGMLLLVVATLGQTIRARGNVKAGAAPERAADFEHLLGLVADGHLRVVHDEHFALDDIAAAHRRVDSGHKVGNVVVRP